MRVGDTFKATGASKGSKSGIKAEAGHYPLMRGRARRRRPNRLLRRGQTARTAGSCEGRRVRITAF